MRSRKRNSKRSGSAPPQRLETPPAPVRKPSTPPRVVSPITVPEKEPVANSRAPLPDPSPANIFGPCIEEKIIPLGTERLLIVGHGVTVEGKVSYCDAVIVEGDFDGTINAKYVVLKEGGKFKGTVVCTSAVISGNVEGTMTCTDVLSLGPTAHIRGDTTYGLLEVVTGAVIVGTLMHAPQFNKEKEEGTEEVTNGDPIVAQGLDGATAVENDSVPSSEGGTPEIVEKFPGEVPS
ncbi:unnamed protein product [Choristocarpus tenellus]